MGDGDAVLVTGGTGLLGTAIAQEFAEQGDTVFITSRSLKKAMETTDCYSSEDTPGEYIPIELDLNEQASIRTALTTMRETARLPSRLVANASYRGALTYSFEDLSHDAFTDLMGVDIAGHVILARELHDDLGAENFQSMTFLSSIYAGQGVDRRIYPDEMAGTPIQYVAVKSAITGVVQTLAARWGPDVRVNSVVAGGVRSPDRQDKEFVSNYEGKTMLERMATPEEVANTVQFVSSDESAYTTGESITVDGGYSAW